MLDLLIKFSLEKRGFILGVFIAVLFFGLQSLFGLSIDVFPDLNRPTVTLMTEGHGMAPEEVESLITIPLENNLNGIPEVERIRSSSGIGLSAVNLEFGWNTDIYRARQLVAERLQVASENLPKDVMPIMGPISSIMGQIQMISVAPGTSNLTPQELRTLAEWTIRPRLLTIPGVSQVISIGGGLRQFQVRIDTEKLNRHQLDLEDLDHQLQSISQNTTGGFLEKAKKEYLIRNIGKITSLDDLRTTVVGMHFGRPVLLGEVADVTEGIRVKRGDGSFNGKPAVIMSVQKAPGADTRKISEQVEKIIADLAPALPPGIDLNPNVFKQADFIDVSISSLQHKLIFGSLFVLLVLIVFLGDIRISLVTLTAIPCSFLITFIVFRYFGLNVNTMTLGGLAIAIGELVDDSIVDIENIHRRLILNAKALQPKKVLRVVYEASSEVRNSIILATLVIVFVFVPLLNLGGLPGRFFSPLAFSYLIALLSSLLISLTLTPALSYLLYRNVKEYKTAHESKFALRIKEWDRHLLERLLDRPRNIWIGVTVAFVIAVGMFLTIGRDFLPSFNEGTAMASVIAPPGVSLTESNVIGKTAEEAILTIPEVKFVSRRTGRAELDEHAEGVNVSEIDIDFKEGGRKREVVLNDIREKLTKIPDITVNVGQPISHRIDHMLSGVPAQIAFKIFGRDLQVLRAKANEAKELFAGIEGLKDLRVEAQTLVPELKINMYRDEVVKYGLNAGEVSKMLETALNGKTVAQYLDDQKIIDIFVQLNENSRRSPEEIGKLVVKTMPTGQRVLLNAIADIYEVDGPNQINRENGIRRIVISANVSGRDLGSTVEDIKKALNKNFKLEQGYFYELGGQFEAEREASRKVLIFSLIALLAVAALLFSHFRSWMLTLQIMVTVPLAFTGGMISLFLMGESLNLASLVGFVSLCGIAVRNGIMMVSHYIHLLEEEGLAFGKEMIIQGSLERLLPVLMTASTAALALLPLVFAKGEPGSEILHPVAVVVVGGLLTSTVLDVLITPTLFYRFGQKAMQSYFKRKQIEKEENLDHAK